MASQRIARPIPDSRRPLAIPERQFTARKEMSLLPVLLLLALHTAPNWADGSSSLLQTCLEKVSTGVCDPSGVLGQEQMQKLNDALQQMEKQTAQEGYAFDKSQREKCGQRGVTMPIVLLKESVPDLSATEKMLVEANRQWTIKNPCERVAIVMLNTGEQIEQRRFWAGRNWNVNVEPSEMVQLYQKEIPLIQKADYVQALLNILQEFSSLLAKRTGPPSNVKVIQQQKSQPSATASGTAGEQKAEMVKAEEAKMSTGETGNSEQAQKKEN